MQFFTIGSYRRLAKNRRELALKKDQGRASMCINCRACIQKCPQGIDIPAELKKVVAVFEKGESVTSLQGENEAQ
jgi:predicted aldo/keto reductase-like oxidoreductase